MLLLIDVNVSRTKDQSCSCTMNGLNSYSLLLTLVAAVMADWPYAAPLPTPGGPVVWYSKSFHSRAALPKSTSPGAHRWGAHVRVERVAEHGHERPRLVEVEHGHEIALYMLRNGGAEKSSSGLIES